MSKGEKIKTARERMGMSQVQFADKIGISKQSLYKYENDIITNIPSDKIEKIATITGLSPSYFMGWEDETNSRQSAIDAIISKHPGLHPIERRKFPMLGSVACGKPIIANEEYDAYVIADANIDADYCVTAKGDSMINARIFDGDIVFIKTMDIVDDGDIAAVCVNDNEVALKRFYYDRNAQIMRLLSENPTYSPMVFVGEELNHVHVLGKAVFFQSIVR